MEVALTTGRLRVAAIAAVATGALLLTPVSTATAQVRGGRYEGTVADPFGEPATSFAGEVALEVAEDGNSVTGRVQANIEGTSTGAGGSLTLCEILDIDFRSTALPVDGAGHVQAIVPLRQTIAEGSCALPIDPTTYDSMAPITIDLDGDDATGQIGTTGDDLVLAFSARRVGSGTGSGGSGSGGGSGGQTSPPGSGSGGQGSGADGALPGLEEYLAGGHLTASTLERLGDLRGCAEEEFEDDERCSGSAFERDRSAVNSLLADGGVVDAIRERNELAVATLTHLTDATGRALVPHARRLLPVVVRLLASSRQPGDEAETAARRLLGFLVAQAVDARS